MILARLYHKHSGKSINHCYKIPLHNGNNCVTISNIDFQQRNVTIMSEIITETNAPKKRMLSGIKPSGDLTLGSYLGAVKNWAERADQYDCFYFMADLHAITVRQNPADLRRRTLEQLAQYIACGLDPEKNTLFIQSHIHQHAELGWVLDCYSQFGELSRMTQFKDKSAKNADNINAGLFTYPSLMAADILLYQPDLVPVGEDQKQHVEFARDIAGYFNTVYGNTFKMPEPVIGRDTGLIPGMDGRKMSKSYDNTIPLMAPEKELKKKIMRIITDSKTPDEPKDPDTSTIFHLYKHFASDTEITEFAEMFRQGGMGYGTAKTILFDKINSVLMTPRAEYERLMANTAELDECMSREKNCRIY